VGEIEAEALVGLNAAIGSLLEDAVTPPTSLDSMVTSTLLTPTGLGGFVGANEVPVGEIFGRRLRATVLVTVSANDADALNEAVVAVTAACLGTDRALLLQKGILRITLDDVGPQAAGVDDATLERALAFDVLYEFLKRPEEAEDVIVEVPINLDTN
jgi:hypothetical protein